MSDKTEYNIFVEFYLLTARYPLIVNDRIKFDQQEYDSLTSLLNETSKKLVGESARGSFRLKIGENNIAITDCVGLYYRIKPVKKTEISCTLQF